MSDGEMTANSVNDWNKGVISEFRANGGRVGGNFEGAPLLILHTKGAKSGSPRENPMMYLELDGSIYVFASKAGANSDPDWYRNLVVNPEVHVELGSESFDAVAESLAGESRSQVYAVQAERFPGFAEYETKTTRVIPVVRLVRT